MPSEVRYWDGSAAGVPQGKYIIDADGLPLRLDAMLAMPQGYRSVGQVLSARPILMAHRGGSKEWPEMSLYAYTRAVEWGIGMLEVSLNRTIDGVWFGLHDQTLDRTSGTTGGDPTTMTWAEVQQYDITAAYTTDPTQPRRPYMRIEELLEAYGQSHTIMFDPKYHAGAARTNELIDLMLRYVPPTRLMGKYFYTARTFSATCRARGIKTWGYAYERDLPTVLDYAADWDTFGMEWSASQGAWDQMKSMGKPVLAHICDSSAAVSAGLAKGADGFQLSVVTSVPHR